MPAELGLVLGLQNGRRGYRMEHVCALCTWKLAAFFCGRDREGWRSIGKERADCLHQDPQDSWIFGMPETCTAHVRLYMRLRALYERSREKRSIYRCSLQGSRCTRRVVGGVCVRLPDRWRKAVRPCTVADRKAAGYPRFANAWKLLIVSGESCFHSGLDHANS